ncbi:sugar ABC transporter permease [Pseudoroseomonas oryzae]|uniref:Sugar ABC transporter permease n=1 Tax=Teichococcus oryzae TaxID=1608942 RepID=A0A5B2TI10_9PROT|nr:sugar ABC transporter permease [Pseudoroseomonas oryzae]
MEIPRREAMGGARAQIQVISALFMREMLTRFGTSRIGYVWLMAEPMILGTMISLLHSLSGKDLPNGLPTFLFYALGYTPFLMFRSIVNRGSGAVTNNISLLFHNRITLLDTMIARNLMEMLVCFTVCLLFIVMGMVVFHEVPHQPALLLAGWFMSALLAHGLAMVIGSAQVMMEWVEHLVHPFTYLLLPISAPFYMLDMLPQGTREALLWNPLVSIHELNRWAMFGDRINPYYDIPYVLAWILGLNLLGMAGLRVARPRLSLSD